MKKVFLRGYFKNNLGDDLFFKTICDRYKNDFYTISNYGNLGLKNLHVRRISFFDKIINRLKYKFFSTENVIERNIEDSCDVTVVIGGSLFVENPSVNIEKSVHLNSFCKSEHDNYMIGVNFGPYSTDKYKNRVRDILENHKDVCFRDMDSYNAFKDCSNVRVAPDILFSLDKSNMSDAKDKIAIVSVIDCFYKNRSDILKSLADVYDNKICDIINKLSSLGYKCILMSFCKFEGDEIACKRINKLCLDKYSIKCDMYFYNGNLDEALNIISKSSLVVGSRFHANVIGMVFDKCIIPISYNCKTVNMLNDIGFEQLRIDIENINSFDVDLITQEVLDYRINIEHIKNESIRHFEKLDDILEVNEGE